MKVEISVAQSTTKSNEEFAVSTSIRNVSSDEQSLQIWSCSYPWQWTTDNPAVHITDTSCKKNDVIHVRLKPNEAYERTLSIHVGIVVEHLAQRPVTFRLRFKSATSDKTPYPIWSNAITINLTE